MTEVLRHIWPHLAAAAIILLALAAASHAVIYKRNPRSAVAWLGVILMFPLVGALLYIMLGINRIQRRASDLRARAASISSPLPRHACSLRDLAAHLPSDTRHLNTLAQVVNRVTGVPLLKGNRVEPFLDGDAAYPAMLSAIRGATQSLTLCTYIFANDRAGKMFTDALAEAVRRGVEVRVLIDYAGSRYSFPPVEHVLRRAGVRTALFMRSINPWLTAYSNLRSHRKILVADGRVGFTGGINIRADNLQEPKPSFPVRDIHFRMEGPVVGQLQQAFAEDWNFATREALAGEPWFPPLDTAGDVIARGITDGPDEDYDKLRQVILGALACARRRIRIVTPYFLPDSDLIAALNTAALRGVEVEILIPQKNNLRLVGWAIRAHLWQVLERGCKVYFTAPPFEHTKIMTVDDAWALVGSANWDPRSLRLNFEFNVEAYDPQFAAGLDNIISRKRAAAHAVTLEEMDARKFPARLRDGMARLFFPYL
ncbi:MAG: Major cardiolipin synthase ClsA [Verrucomicrobia bacterium ADurb.Bin345]|nr:MAG: Major cardiolipin synthase ClsA [Verrucomicrobia bacterium ADurb.Bin345]